MAVGSAVRRWWTDVPQDLGVLVCQCLGASDVVSLLAASRRTRDVGAREEVWRFFCCARWGRSANLGAYAHAKDLYLDCNGWFPQRYGRRRQPAFDVQRLTLRSFPCLTMDLRITDDEIIAVSEAPRGRFGGQPAMVHVVDPDTCKVRDRFAVSEATINCCDVSSDLICIGSDDSKVRLYRRSGGNSEHDGYAAAGFSPPRCAPTTIPPWCYQAACEVECASEVNDLRFVREDAVLAVRTQQNRHPAGLDLIPLRRPDARMSFPGGSSATNGKYIHALDGFEEGCSLSEVVCSGEHPLTSVFSVMLFDFRRPAPCVVDLPVTSVRQGQTTSMMLWPLRAGRRPRVYANLLHEEGRGTIAMVDFRYPSADVTVLFQLPNPVDDFRCFGGSLYAACTDSVGCHQRLGVHRCSPAAGNGAPERLCTVVETYDGEGRSPREDLKVFSVCSRGFAISYGEHLALGAVASPSEVDA